MRCGIVAENLLERIGLASGMVPEPMLEGYGSAFARAVTVGVELGIFEVLALEPMSVGAVSEWCGTDPRATEKLLNLFVGARYLHRTSDGTYRLTKRARRWLVERSPQSVRDMVL